MLTCRAGSRLKLTLSRNVKLYDLCSDTNGSITFLINHKTEIIFCMGPVSVRQCHACHRCVEKGNIDHTMRHVHALIIHPRCTV